MDTAHLMPLELPPASSLNNNNRGKGRSSFFRRLALGFGVLAVLGLLYVPAYHSVQGPIQGLGEIAIPSLLGASRSMGSLAQLPGWSYNTTRDVRVYIQPEHNTTIISPIGVCVSPPLLIVIVCSAVTNVKERQVIRDTWASKSNIENVYNSSVEVVFLVGQSDNETLHEVLENENSHYKDIIQENFLDTYNNLTIKSIMMLKWATTNCGQAKFIMKTDDDMFINIPLLVKLLQARSEPNGALVGSLICNAKPIVDPKNKWFMPKYMFAQTTYPNYLSGTGYVMSLDVASKLYLTALETPLLYLEDVYLTGICAKRAKLRPTNHPGFSFAARKLDACVFRVVITAHRVSPKNLYTMWDKVNNSTIKCTNSSLNHKEVKLSRKTRNAGHFSVRRKSINRCV